MMTTSPLVHDPFDALGTFRVDGKDLGIYRIRRLEDLGLASIDQMPYSIRVLLESVLRHCDNEVVVERDVQALAGWSATNLAESEVPFHPSRVVLQDFTGVPSVVDLAAMRSAMKRLGGDPARINPLIPVDLVIDHSVQVDQFGNANALQANVDLEFHRNQERYEFLRWGQHAFTNFRAVPPNIGIVHQVNLEFLAHGAFMRKVQGRQVVIPDTCVGTDSHTTMINGLGILGWGVGGIEAESAMLGQPLYMLMPEVVGCELAGELPAGATATDLVLTVTQMLREEGVVGAFVEFYGSGISRMPLADRATIANMAPEYGATMGYFPFDDETLRYLRRTGRPTAAVELVDRYTKELGIFRTGSAPMPRYSRTVRLDLHTVESCLAGPKRPQDRIPLHAVKDQFAQALRAPLSQRGFALSDADVQRVAVVTNGHASSMTHGAVVIAAITSCTNTSNPSVMIAAGLLARNAVKRGLTVPSYVKTSLAPGSRVVSDYLARAGLDKALEKLGFFTVGYGCTTCIGNSGPLPGPVAKAVTDGQLIAAAVLSGNRNFEGRINPLVQANYLASPPLVVAYALAGTTNRDLTREPLGTDRDGKDVYLHEIWPTAREIQDVMAASVTPEMFHAQYARAFDGNEQWNHIPVSGGQLYDWNPQSTYIQEPPFLATMARHPRPLESIQAARVLCLLGDSITTDHISPAGSISKDSPAGQYLIAEGVTPPEFNSYGSRRGNDRVMVRGTFANIRIRNRMAPGTEGGWTSHVPSGEVMTIYDASLRYEKERVPLLILAGSEYGTGSSRDWAAKGTLLLGVRAVIAVSYERIHRSNLVGMGVLPLEFVDGQNAEKLGLTGRESFDIAVTDGMEPHMTVPVVATADDGRQRQFLTRSRIDTPIEQEYYRHGGILPLVLRKLLAT